VELNDVMERMEAAMAAMEAAAAKMAESQVQMMAAAEERVGRIVATVENEREMELQRRLEQAEAKIAELQAAGAGARKTAQSGVAAMVAKHGAALESVDAASIDAALASLNIEQRIAVKAELLRAGVIG
jgi:hypothetical protein